MCYFGKHGVSQQATRKWGVRLNLAPLGPQLPKKWGEAPLAPDGQNHYHALELALSPLDC